VGWWIGGFLGWKNSPVGWTGGTGKKFARWVGPWVDSAAVGGVRSRRREAVVGLDTTDHRSLYFARLTGLFLARIGNSGKQYPGAGVGPQSQGGGSEPHQGGGANPDP
jgi:hypothetical protein